MSRGVLRIESRQYIALGLIAGIVLVLLAGLIKLQVLDHQELARRSDENRIRVRPLIPRRGVVTDRDGRIIIDNRPSFTVSILPAEMAGDTTIEQLASLLSMEPAEVERRFRRNLVSRYQPAPIKRDVNFETVAILEEQAHRYPGVSISMEDVRRYTPDLGAESFTGYVGEVSEDELQRTTDTSLRMGTMIGKKGIEKYYDSLLRGTEGWAYIEVTASGQALGPYQAKQPRPAVAGADLLLSIDNDLQRVCVAELDTFCCGAVVAMDPRNGEILAMTSYPGFDANIFSSVIPESLWQAITNDTTHPLLNRPLDGQYPPGSTTKLVTIGAALEKGLINRQTTLRPCAGGYQFGNRYFRCWREAGHGSTTPVTAIEVSCDVYLYQVGIKLGVDGLSEYLGACGFGRPVGIDLPREAPGLNPNSAYLDERYGQRQWSRGIVLNLAIGQGEILATPLQLAQFYCGLANDGVVYRPHLVRQIRYPDGVTRATTPSLSFDLPFGESTRAVLLEGLRRVVEGDNGTARFLRNDVYTIGGKTGTAENPHGDNHSWFVGLAPLEDPQIVVAAIVENAGHGSDVAAPLVGAVIREFMRKKLESEDLAVATGRGER
ncbi:MAG: penicillin-binding protein 2 [bacterium]